MTAVVTTAPVTELVDTAELPPLTYWYESSVQKLVEFELLVLFSEPPPQAVRIAVASVTRPVRMVLFIEFYFSCGDDENPSHYERVAACSISIEGIGLLSGVASRRAR